MSDDPEQQSEGLNVETLRELFRNLVAFRSYYEATGLDSLTGPDGELWSLWDLEYLFTQVAELPKRQREAITLHLLYNYREREAAVKMGLKETNPIAMYANVGLGKIVEAINSGKLSRYAPSSSRLASGG